MKRIIIILILLACIITPALGTISGTVKNAGGNPIYNAVVQIGGVGGAYVITGTSGAYSFSTSPGATQELYADAMGYGPKYQDVTMPGSGSPVVLNIVLTANGERVVYNAGFEIANGGKVDGWKTQLTDNGDQPIAGTTWDYNYDAATRSTLFNSTPGGVACGVIHTGTPLYDPRPPNVNSDQAWTYGMLVPNDLITVDPTRLYNFYFKIHKSATIPCNVYWRLAWLDGSGNRIWSHGLEGGNTPSTNNWEQVSTGMFRENGWAVGTMLRVAPPANAVYAQIRFGQNGPFYGATTELQSFFDDVVLDEVPPMSLADAKLLANGRSVSFTGEIVTAVAGKGGVPPGVFYMEEPTKAAGIRVASSKAVDVGNAVRVDGVMATTPAGERYVNAAYVSAASGMPVEPVVVNTQTVQTDSTKGALLVKVTATVRAVAGSYFTIGDGYMVGGIEKTTKVVDLTGTLPNVNDLVLVTGVVSKDTPTENSILVRPEPVLPTPTNYWRIGFEPSEGYVLGAVVGQPASAPAASRWKNTGTAAVVASPNPAFGTQSLKLMPGRVDILDNFGSAALQFAIVKFYVWREASAANTLQWWGDSTPINDLGYSNLDFTCPAWYGTGGKLPSVTGRFAEIVCYYEFTHQVVSTWYDGKLMDNQMPIGAAPGNRFTEMDFLYGAGTGVTYIDNIEVGYKPE